jgi:hypothetical protein
MTTRRIHVNSNTVRSNAKHGTNKPSLTIRVGQKVEAYAHEVIITGASRVIYRPENPLVCGAKVWIETDSEVIPVLFEGEFEESVDTCQVSE